MLGSNQHACHPVLAICTLPLILVKQWCQEPSFIIDWFILIGQMQRAFFLFSLTHTTAIGAGRCKRLVALVPDHHAAGSSRGFD